MTNTVTPEDLTATDIEIPDRETETDEDSGASESFFDSKTNLDAMAQEQGISVVADFDKLLGDFWPEDESVDEFIATVRRWRCEDNQGVNTP